MTMLAKATAAPKLNHKNDVYVGWATAGVIVIMLVAQLFTFEKFAPMIESFGLGGGEPLSKVLVSIVVIAELFALPFLLRMRLSPLMRIVSMASGWIVAAWWAYLALFTLAPGLSVSNVGFFGSIIRIPAGVLAVAYAALLAALALRATYVLWPHAKRIRIPFAKK